MPKKKIKCNLSCAVKSSRWLLSNSITTNTDSPELHSFSFTLFNGGRMANCWFHLVALDSHNVWYSELLDGQQRVGGRVSTHPPTSTPLFHHDLPPSLHTALCFSSIRGGDWLNPTQITLSRATFHIITFLQHCGIFPETTDGVNELRCSLSHLQKVALFVHLWEEMTIVCSLQQNQQTLTFSSIYSVCKTLLSSAQINETVDTLIVLLWHIDQRKQPL